MSNDIATDSINAAVAERAQHYDLHEFLDGMADCRDGKPHTDGTASYNAGYQSQYELQQIREHRYAGRS